MLHRTEVGRPGRTRPRVFPRAELVQDDADGFAAIVSLELADGRGADLVDALGRDDGNGRTPRLLGGEVVASDKKHDLALARRQPIGSLHGGPRRRCRPR